MNSDMQRRASRGEWKAVGAMTLLLVFLLGWIVMGLFVPQETEQAATDPAKLRPWV